MLENLRGGAIGKATMISLVTDKSAESKINNARREIVADIMILLF